MLRSTSICSILLFSVSFGINGQCDPATAPHYNIGDFPFVSLSGITVSQAGTYSSSAGPYTASCGTVDGSSFTLYPGDGLIFNFSQPVFEITIVAGAMNNTENGTVTTNNGVPTIVAACPTLMNISGNAFEYIGPAYDNIPLTISIPGGATQVVVNDLPAASTNGYYTVDLVDCFVVNTCTPTSLTPDLGALPDLNDECAVGAPTPPTATNDCGTTVGGIADLTFPITTQGTTVVTWTFDDGTNSTTQTQNVIIADNTIPVPDMDTIPDFNGFCFVDSLPSPSAMDNCAGTISGVPDVSFPITSTGTTIVNWTYDDGNGNTFTQPQTVNITGVDVSVTQNGSTLVANQLVAAYQWLDCDNAFAPLSGEVNQFFDVPATGSYAVEITYNGCADISSCILVDLTGMEEIDASLLALVPNPTSSGSFTINYSGKIESVVIYDMSGRIMNAAFSATDKIINVSALESGNYLVRIVADSGIATKELIIIQ